MPPIQSGSPSSLVAQPDRLGPNLAGVHRGEPKAGPLVKRNVLTPVHGFPDLVGSLMQVAARRSGQGLGPRYSRLRNITFAQRPAAAVRDFIGRECDELVDGPAGDAKRNRGRLPETAM